MTELDEQGTEAVPPEQAFLSSALDALTATPLETESAAASGEDGPARPEQSGSSAEPEAPSAEPEVPSDGPPESEPAIPEPAVVPEPAAGEPEAAAEEPEPAQPEPAAEEPSHAEPANQLPVTQPQASPESALPAEFAASRPSVPWWPFLVYLGMWLVGVGAAAWMFLQTSSTASIAGEAIYPYVLRGGLVLTALGPLVALGVWFVCWIVAGRGHRTGLLADSLLKGALTTLTGVVVWWVMLMAVDRVRFDRLW